MGTTLEVKKKRSLFSPWSFPERLRLWCKLLLGTSKGSKGRYNTSGGGDEGLTFNTFTSIDFDIAEEGLFPF